MLINPPLKYKNSNLTEGQAMLATFLLIICDDHGFDNWYTINSYDFRKILGNGQGMTMHDSPSLEPLKEYMHIAALSDETWAFKFKIDDIKKWVPSRGTEHIPRTFRYKLKETRTMCVWSYLMGRYDSDNDLIVDSDTVIEYKEAGRYLKRLHYENFKVEKLK